jgi:hypothetical protein
LSFLSFQLRILRFSSFCSLLPCQHPPQHPVQGRGDPGGRHELH